jgi:uncharacterized membrane protein YfcA
MDLYLPIAELSVNLFLLLAIGGGVGFLSGVFGVGGGFLMTPLLIFIGIPAEIAVGTGTLQVLASSVSGVLAQMRRSGVDVRMGAVLVLGGAVGSALGIILFQVLRASGVIDTFVVLSYVFFLGSVGAIMFIESARAMLQRHVRRGPPSRQRLHQHYWLHRLPLKFRFPASRLYISALVPFATGACIGVLTAVMGVGGGFILIPAMVYIIGMPTAVVVGTSLFQLCFVSAISAFLHAVNNQTVDVILAVLLIAGGVVGTQFGSRAGAYLRGDQLRILLALIVLTVCGRLALDLVRTPVDPFSIAAG